MDRGDVKDRILRGKTGLGSDLGYQNKRGQESLVCLCLCLQVREERVHCPPGLAQRCGLEGGDHSFFSVHISVLLSLL